MKYWEPIALGMALSIGMMIFFATAGYSVRAWAFSLIPLWVFVLVILIMLQAWNSTMNKEVQK